MKLKEVTVFGATGLIGSSLLEILLNDTDCGKVNVVTRAPFSIINKKIESHVISATKQAPARKPAHRRPNLTSK